MRSKTTVPPAHIHKTGAICEKLWVAATDLLDSSLELEDALINRRVDEIWEILSEQEKKSSSLNQAAQLWNQVYGENLESLSPELQAARSDIREKLQRFQIAERVNYSLTRNYLAVIEKSMLKAGAGFAGKKTVYNKGGRVGLKNSSLIFKSIG
jgi:hypothetical protein